MGGRDVTGRIRLWVSRFADETSNPDISRLRGVHLRGTEGRSCTHVPQAHYNKVNERLGVA